MTKSAPQGARLSVLFSAEEIAARIHLLAGEIAATAEHDLLVVPILTGSFIFAADLLRALHEAGVAPEMDFISLSSYGTGQKSRGEVQILHDTELRIEGRDVLLVDDILESGRTLARATDLMVARGAARVRSCVLLDKPGKLAVRIKADFTGFDCPDRFVVGYGLDDAHAWRQLPFIGYLEN